MQPKLCTKCKKNIAVVFITKVENGVSTNEGFCLKCARSLGIPQIDAAVRQMGFSEEDLDYLSDDLSNMFGQNEMDNEDDPDERESRTATFPMINQLFNQMNPGKSIYLPSRNSPRRRHSRAVANRKIKSKNS